MTSWFYFFDLCGIEVFALYGTLAAVRHRMDPFSVIVLASVTAIGSGSILDVLLDTTQIFWIRDPNYIIVILLTVLITMLIVRKPKRIHQHALVLALFTVICTEKALSIELGAIITIVMGLITSVGGGMILDFLCRQVPMTLRAKIYATASILGRISYSLSLHLSAQDKQDKQALVFPMIVALEIRLAAIKWHLSLPAFDLKTNLQNKK